MSAPVDVLAVMDEAAHCLNSSDYRDDRDALLVARAAVAELIEQDRVRRLQYAGVIGLLCELSTRITDDEEQELLDRAVADWCATSGWSWRRTIDRVEVFPPDPPALARVQGGAA